MPMMPPRPVMGQPNMSAPVGGMPPASAPVMGGRGPMVGIMPVMNRTMPMTTQAGDMLGAGKPYGWRG